MKRTVYNTGKAILAPFPKTKVFFKKAYRSIRTGCLKMRHPNGAFLICNGAKVFCDFSSENYFWYDGYSAYLDYELKVFTSLFGEKAPNVILDVGAHWGFYSAFLETTECAQRIAKLVSIEADPVNFNILSKTLAQVSRIPVMQVNAAISDKDGFVDLYSGDGTCKQTYYSSDATRVGKTNAISLDGLTKTFLGPEEYITHVKLDIDGYEPAFFAGGKETLEKYHPVIMTEFWAKGLKESGFDLDEYWDMMQNNYYVKEACFPDPQLNILGYEDLSYLVEKTMQGITNLVLIPKL